MTSPVGHPVAELLLQDQLAHELPYLLPSGRGRSLKVLREWPLREGRPDFIILSVNGAALRRFVQSGVEFSREADAQVAGLAAEGLEEFPSEIARRLGYSESYVRTMLRDLRSRGLNLRALHRDADVVARSVIVEVKVGRWWEAIRQTRRYRGLAHTTAIAVPAGAVPSARRDAGTYMDRTGTGLIAVQGDAATWVRRPRQRSGLSIGAGLWLAELARRHDQISSS